MRWELPYPIDQHEVRVMCLDPVAVAYEQLQRWLYDMNEKILRPVLSMDEFIECLFVNKMMSNDSHYSIIRGEILIPEDLHSNFIKLLALCSQARRQYVTDILDYAQMNRDLDITKSRVFFRPDAAFFGPLLCSLDFSWDESVHTAATNGSQLFWAPSDFLRCKEEDKGEDKSTLMHELWHNARLHDVRRGDRCSDIWNHACDIWINRNLAKEGYYIGTDWLIRPDLDHIELEEDIYDHLKQPGGGGASGKNTCSHGSLPSAGQAQIQSQIASVVKAIQAAKMAGQPGAIPGSMEQIVDRFLAPIIPWEQHLYNWMNDLLDEDYTWARPNRRHSDIYLPSRYEEDGRLEHLIYFQDVSGSITDRNILRFNSELKFVWDTFKPKKMTVAQFDTRITRVDEFTEGDPYEKIKIVGRGGTSLVPVRDMIIKEEPTAAIIFSDMCVAPMQPLPIEIPILWIAVDARGAKVPFGKMIHIKD